ncbi:MAG TPA: non-canonical purine NTP pyrophosphatase [Candidatus Limnocylindrales bacterium]|nr:non-canonical purine NTP pyrophosphatase [Candidatus Limnocylindrales bacterium]
MTLFESLVVASLNPKKAHELAELLADIPLRVVSLADVPGATLPPEGEHSYAENALAKARAGAALAGTIALGDDSGLEVDALGGAPGVRTARFGGEGLSDIDRYRLLLERLAGVPAARRTARFRCVIALASPDGRERVVEGVAEGVIADAPRGTGGFGYDPVFYYPPFACTFAELDAERKAQVSHRGIAVRSAAEALRTFL